MALILHDDRRLLTRGTAFVTRGATVAPAPAGRNGPKRTLNVTLVHPGSPSAAPPTPEPNSAPRPARCPQPCPSHCPSPFPPPVPSPCRWPSPRPTPPP